jgi:hypothetical protein
MIVTTRVAIDALVAAQGPRYAREAAEARDRVNQQFQQLERQVETAGRQVRNALETRRERAMEAVDQALAEIQAENASLVDRLVNFVRSIYNALRQFFALMVRIEEMGIGTFLRRALDQAKNGVKNHLWNELKIAFQEWLMMKLGPLALLFNLPSNFLDILASAATNMFSLVLEALPEALPALGIAAMTWLAIQLAAKLIPGMGAIMAIIDAIRAAWSLIQSLIRAASAFFDFLLLVVGGGDGSQAFARALAWGIIAAVDALLTFLGVDSLLRRIAGPIGRPVGRIFGRLRTSLARRGGRRARGRRRRDEDRRQGHRRGDGEHRARAASSRARADRRAEGNRRRTRNERRAARDRRADPRRRNDDRRRRENERRRRREEANRLRLERAVRSIQPRAQRLLSRGVSKFRLRATLLLWRVRHRLSSLTVSRGGAIRATINPSMEVIDGVHIDDRELGRMMLEVFRPAMEQALAEIRRTRAADVANVQTSIRERRGIPAGTSRSTTIAALNNMPGIPGRVPLTPQAHAYSPSNQQRDRFVSGRVQGPRGGFANGVPIPPPGLNYESVGTRGAGAPGSQRRHHADFLAQTWEPARRPEAALQYQLSDRMNQADPAQPGFGRDVQRHGGPGAGALVPGVGAQNPLAPTGAMAGDERTQEHLEFSTGVITRMVLQAARGTEGYSLGGVPVDLARRMDNFVRMAVRPKGQQGTTYARNLRRLRNELVAALRAFFMSL